MSIDIKTTKIIERHYNLNCIAYIVCFLYLEILELMNL